MAVLLALGLALLAIASPGGAQEGAQEVKAPTSARPAGRGPTGPGLCGEFVVWTGLHYFTAQEGQPFELTVANLLVRPVTFCSGPYATADEARAAAQALSLSGSFGNQFVDCYAYNHLYVREFFAPRQIIRSTYQSRCIR